MGNLDVFKDVKKTYEMYEELWKYAVFELGLGDKLRGSGISVLFIITDPPGYLYVDPDNVLIGEEAKKKGEDAVVKMELSVYDAHKFWLRKLKLPVAIGTRKIKAKGPLPKLMKLVPYLKPVHEAYPKFCEKYGVPTS